MQHLVVVAFDAGVVQHVEELEGRLVARVSREQTEIAANCAGGKQALYAVRLNPEKRDICDMH